MEEHRRRTACAWLLAYSASIYRKKKKSRVKKVCVKSWLLNKSLLNELMLHDKDEFRRYLRMNTATFEELLEKIAPKITKQKTHLRNCIPAEEKLAITLRYLAAGESFKSLQYQYRIISNTICQFIKPVCDAIYLTLKDEFLKMPDSEEDWIQIAEETDARWQFPNAFAAADGKHIQLIHPQNSGAQFSYKGFDSVVLLALADYDYKFMYVDVGCQGRISDSGVFCNSEIYGALIREELNLPNARPLLNEVVCWENNDPLPFVFVADDAFPLFDFCMKPFPYHSLNEEQKQFIYRLSRFRRISENTFGIWVNRFRLFTTRVYLTPEKAVSVILALIALHNMLREKSRNSYTPSGFVDQIDLNGNIREGSWRDQSEITNSLNGIPATSSRNSSLSSIKIRERFMHYFCNEGSVSWQWKHVL